MIYDRIENIETYTAISERLAKGLRLLRTTDFSAMEAGKYEVDGTELYYMLQCYQSKEQNDKPEAHKKYIDIQYIVEGEEQIGVGAQYRGRRGSGVRAIRESPLLLCHN